MTKKINSFSNEDGSTYDYEKVSPKILKMQNDRTELIVSRSGWLSLIEEMVNNEPIVGGAKNLIESLICSEKTFVKPADVEDHEQAKEYAKLIQDMLDDMEKPFIESIKDAFTFTDYGFSLCEMLFKKRLGYHPENPKKHSKYNDGLWAPRKLAPRPQKTITKWSYDEYGRVKSVRQSNPTTRDIVEIPYEKLLHFKIKSYNDDPEGTSIFRNCALTYYAKRKIKRTQQSRYERGFEGVPTIKLPGEWCNKADTEHQGIRTWAETTVKNIRFSQDAGLVIPEIINPKTLKSMITFEIISGDATSVPDAEKLLDRCDREMASSILSDFFLSGSSASVAGSLGSIKIETFAQFVVLMLNAFVGEINNKFIPLIFEMNKWDKKFIPKLCHTNLVGLNENTLMLHLQSSGKSGLITPTHERDNALNNFLFRGLLPEVTKEEWEENIKRNNKSNLNSDSSNSKPAEENVDSEDE